MEGRATPARRRVLASTCRAPFGAGLDYQCRRESLLAVDEGVGAMVAALRAKGELDNTLFIFTSDNGFFQGEHRVKRSKIKVYEPSVRVPALMRGPGVPRDKRVPDLTGQSTWHRRSPTPPALSPAGPSTACRSSTWRASRRFPGRLTPCSRMAPAAAWGARVTAHLHQPLQVCRARDGERELYDLR